MVTGTMAVELHLPGNGSLKEKRQVLQSLKAGLGNKFNVSVAETAHQDLWQRAELGIAVVGANRVFVEREMENVFKFIEGRNGVDIIDHSIEYF